MGLRERKKLRTRQAISDAAVTLFLAAGFDHVSVAEVAEAAEVSRRTLFAYFPTKEDLVLHRFADHEDEPARVVRARPDGQPPLDALHEHLLDRLAHRDANTGLSDDPEVMAFHRLLTDTPSLGARLLEYLDRGVRTLADALAGSGDDLTTRLAAVQVISVQRVLAEDNVRAITGGATADDRYPVAVAAADHAYDLLRAGLAEHLR
ncbi:TetR family transcriptional regulator [Solihabitans fulvus]|uniref:TetR family transcriptional regulator n=1 Tax=Solihabitans fulvus TaxID=1892852 RepID=A0A5B2WU75_9PSEU|nr:TetR family transcriptional regulator [Solihabitans fulvus]